MTVLLHRFRCKVCFKEWWQQNYREPERCIIECTKNPTRTEYLGSEERELKPVTDETRNAD